MHNLVKQRFVVEKKDSARIIDSNEKMDKIIQKNDNSGFSQGLYAPHLEVKENTVSPEPLSGIEALVSESSQNDGEEQPLEQQPLEQQKETEGSVYVENPELDMQMDDSQDYYEEKKAEADALLEQARIEAEQILQDAYNDGIVRVNSELEQRRAELENEFQVKAQELEQSYQERFDTLETDVIDSLVLIIEDVLHVSITDYKPIIVELAKQVMFDLDGVKTMQIQVSESNHEYVRDRMTNLRSEFAENVKIDVVRNVELSDESCRIETEFGTYDCGFDTQLSNLIGRMKVLSRQRD